ncbi:MAG: hypothetical protein BKP49_02115 [Treponema sp. CETP13]|nr:MAG: hypothetical protein BKP49_02115 [Treponema sp. CETP13]
MNQDKVKDILLQIEETSVEFTVTFSGKSSKKVNGLYKPETQEIILHNKNFKTDNQLIYTAIHEYTHHLLNEKQLNSTAGLAPKKTRVHTNEFWTKFHELLDIAEQKNLYSIGVEESQELSELTVEIRDKYLRKNGELMLEFGKLLAKAHNLCETANVRYEDYIDRVLKLPRSAAKSISKVSAVQPDPAIGFENMKMIAGIADEKKRNEAQDKLLSGSSPDTIRSMMKRKAQETDEKTKLEKEKTRLEKTINQLSSRLELINESLASL